MVDGLGCKISLQSSQPSDVLAFKVNRPHGFTSQHQTVLIRVIPYDQGDFSEGTAQAINRHAKK